MCKVIIENPKEKIGFILYNHLYIREGDPVFTIPELIMELKKEYHLDVSEEEVKKEINSFLEDGLVMRTFSGYTCTTML